MLADVVMGSIGVLCCSLVIWGWVLFGNWFRCMVKSGMMNLVGIKSEIKPEQRLIYQWDNLLGYDGKEKDDYVNEK